MKSASKGGFIDAEKMNSLKNFTDESCLEFGAQHNFLLKKIGRIMPWFVNAYSNLPVADFYRQKIDEILKMDEDQWNRISPTLIEEDKKLSQRIFREWFVALRNKIQSIYGCYFRLFFK